MSQLDTADEMIASLRAQVSSLTAENERLRTDLANLEAGKGELYDDLLEADTALQAYRGRAEAAEHALSSLRELESAARAVDRAWREESGTGARVVAPLRLLAAAVDALPPTPPATEGSDDTA